MEMNNKCLMFDRAMVVTLCLLIYFLPISIALVETFAGMTVLIFLLKRIYLIFANRIFTGKNFKIILSRFYALIKPVDTGVNKWLAFYVIAAALSCLFSIETHKSWMALGPKLIERSLLFLAFVESMTTKKRINWFIGIFFTSAWLVSSSGLYQFFTGTDFIRGFQLAEGRIKATLSHPNDFGLYLVTIIPLLLGTLFYLLSLFKLQNGKECNKGSWRMLACILFVVLILGLCLTNIGFTFSRGAWLGLLAAIMFWTFKQNRLWYINIFLIIFFFYILFPMGTILRNKNSGQPQITNGFDIQFKAFVDPKGRQTFWMQALSVIKERPLLGSGFSTYVHAVKKYHEGKIWMEEYYAHNCYLQIWAETGLLGLTAFICFVFMIYKKSFTFVKGKDYLWMRSLFYCVAAGLCGYLFHIFFDTGFYSVQLSTLFWLMCGLLISSAFITGQDGKIN